MKTFNHPTFGTSQINKVEGNAVTITTESGETKRLMKSFVEQFTGRLADTVDVEIKRTGNGYFTIIVDGQTIEAREVTRQGFKQLDTDIYVNSSTMSKVNTVKTLKNHFPETPTSVNF